mgnify:CR=1 FL=1
MLNVELSLRDFEFFNVEFFHLLNFSMLNFFIY